MAWRPPTRYNVSTNKQGYKTLEELPGKVQFASKALIKDCNLSIFLINIFSLRVLTSCVSPIVLYLF